ncbi:MAG: carboxylesterase/lipase family protein [Burkholderiales bacterium]|nr:carboxylesterase/lipase family protein [Burkholderiales bacterium]
MASAEPIAHTPLGALQGLRERGVCAWLGVPYAEPPVGALRYRPPQPAEGWSGVRTATTFGAACPQKQVGDPKMMGPRFDEDCLVLNIWSPAPDAARRPVMVWIHGGGFMVGSARAFTGTHLALQGDMVVVSINYRLGALGFVNFGEALGDDRIASNLGLRDQIEALRWVRRNIAAFGGDPDRVTIAGESAGAMSVSLLMHAPEARPLFRAAIAQSGALSLIHDRAMSLHVARLYLDRLGVRSLADLQAQPVQALQDAREAIAKQVPDTLPAAPWFDGALLPESMAAACAAPTPAIPLLAGFNRDEIRMFELIRGVADVFLARESMARLLRSQLGGEAARRVLAAYPDTKVGNRQLGTHMSFGLPTLHFAERHALLGHPTWFYRLDLGGLLGAAHGVDLLFLWEMPGLMAMVMRGGPLWGRRAALAQRMRAHWLSFVREGRPGESWPRFDAERRATLVFDRHDRVIDDSESAQRPAWAGRDCGPGIAAVPTVST